MTVPQIGLIAGTPSAWNIAASLKLVEIAALAAAVASVVIVVRVNRIVKLPEERKTAGAAERKERSLEPTIP